MNVAQRIYRFNAGRDAALLERKYARLASDPFVFLRGTCHLFYADWHGGRVLDAAPRTWISGDLHLENFGSYKGDNRLAYFDLNDFDEAALAPCTWEIARFIVSLHVAAHSLELRQRDARALARSFLDAWVAAVIDGKPRWIERSIATGMIGTLLSQVEQRRRKDFLDKHTRRVGERRRLLLDGKRLLPLERADREALLDWCRDHARDQNDRAFEPLDAARRAAGTGSLGLPRYAVLVRGGGRPNRNYVLDLKLAASSAAGRRLERSQPTWANEAARIVDVQWRAQAIAPAFIRAVKIAGRDFVLRELQPVQDRLDLHAAHTDTAALGATMVSMGKLVAWSALRTSGRNGSASADELIAFARESAWRKPLVEYVESYASRVVADWREFRTAWKSR